MELLPALCLVPSAPPMALGLVLWTSNRRWWPEGCEDVGLGLEGASEGEGAHDHNGADPGVGPNILPSLPCRSNREPLGREPLGGLQNTNLKFCSRPVTWKARETSRLEEAFSC